MKGHYLHPADEAQHSRPHNDAKKALLLRGALVNTPRMLLKSNKVKSYQSVILLKTHCESLAAAAQLCSNTAGQ